MYSPAAATVQIKTPQKKNHNGDEGPVTSAACWSVAERLCVAAWLGVGQTGPANGGRVGSGG